MNGLTLAQRLAVTEFLAKHFASVRKGKLNPEAASEMDVGERHAARFGGRRVAWVSMPAPATRATVKNEAALLAWVRKYLPGEIETVERVRPASARQLGEQMKAHGGWADDDGVLIPVDGIEVSTSGLLPRVELDDDAAELIAAAWQRGEIDLGGVLALPAEVPAPAPGIPLPDPGPGPGRPAEPVMTEKTPFGPPFCDEHGFVSPEMAAMHAVMVQGGYSTPPIEAYGMARSCDDIEAGRGLAWIKKHGLDPADPREGADTPWPLPEPDEDTEAAQ